MHDVFISYSSRDKSIADAVCAGLEARGTRCWFAPRDIRPGSDWGASIVSAIRSCRAMVLVFSKRANESNHIPREVEQAVKSGVPVIPFRIEAVVPLGSLEYNLSSVHWLDAITPPMDAHIRRLGENLTALMGDDSPTERALWPVQHAESTPSAHPSSSTQSWVMAVLALVAVASVLVLLILQFGSGGSAGETTSHSGLTRVPEPVPAPEPVPPEVSPPTVASGPVEPEPVVEQVSTPSQPTPEAVDEPPTLTQPAPPDQIATADRAETFLELQRIREQQVLVATRARAVLDRLENFEAQQRALGLSLRGDMATAKAALEVQLEESGLALGAGDAEGAARSLTIAERNLEQLEGFLGR